MATPSKNYKQAQSAGQVPEQGRGGWGGEVESKLDEAVSIGVRSSRKSSTRQHRVLFYTQQLAAAQAEAQYYERMLRLEKEMAAVEEADKRFPWSGTEAESSAGEATPLGSEVDGLYAAGNNRLSVAGMTLRE